MKIRRFHRFGMFWTGLFNCVVTIYAIVLLISSPVAISFYTSPLYRDISKLIRSTSTASVYHKGSPYYEKRRQVKNGLCTNIYPDLVVVPKSTMDVSKIVKISRHYQVPISVRSGGHSFLCTSTRPGNITCGLIPNLNNIRF